MCPAWVVDLEARSARVVVPDYQLSLAIGRDGQNAQLAARLTGGGSIFTATREQPSDTSAAGAEPTGRAESTVSDRAGARGVDWPMASLAPSRQKTHSSNQEPIRTCVGCRERASKADLVRLVILDGTLTVDRDFQCRVAVRICIHDPIVWNQHFGGEAHAHCAGRGTSMSTRSANSSPQVYPSR